MRMVKKFWGVKIDVDRFKLLCVGKKCVEKKC